MLGDLVVDGLDGTLGGEEEDRETVFLVVVVVVVLVVESEVGNEAGCLDDDDEPSLEFFGRRPEIRGGGSSRPSAALRESWRAKSEACHHSRNFSAKMEVGRSTLRLERRRG